VDEGDVARAVRFLGGNRIEARPADFMRHTGPQTPTGGGK
jgi:hypothetical protein